MNENEITVPEWILTMGCHTMLSEEAKHMKDVDRRDFFKILIAQWPNLSLTTQDLISRAVKKRRKNVKMLSGAISGFDYIAEEWGDVPLLDNTNEVVDTRAVLDLTHLRFQNLEPLVEGETAKVTS